MSFNAVFRLVCMACLCLLALTHCAPLKKVRPVLNPTMYYAQYKKTLQALSTWSISGLVGVVMPKKTASANVRWSQKAKSYVILVSGPLGIGATKISGDDHGVVLLNAKGKKFQAKNAKTLMAQNLGWSVPVSGLAYWIKGVVSPLAPSHFSLNAFGVVKQIEQNGWVIKYSGYHYEGKWILPKKIILQQPGLRVTLIINQWQIT